MFISAPVLHTVAAASQSFHICMVEFPSFPVLEMALNNRNHPNSHFIHLCVTSIKIFTSWKYPHGISALLSPLKCKHLLETLLWHIESSEYTVRELWFTIMNRHITVMMVEGKQCYNAINQTLSRLSSFRFCHGSDTLDPLKDVESTDPWMVDTAGQDAARGFLQLELSVVHVSVIWCVQVGFGVSVP